MLAKILFISLGCDKNLVDTEMMMGLLRDRGYSFTDFEEEADAAIINTCCFIGDAKEESINTILEIAALKKTAQLKALLVTGCLAQRYQEEIQKEIPEVDAIVGTSAIDEIVPALDAALAGNARNFYKALHVAPVTGVNRVITTTGGHYSYLKIAEGCDKRCTYCIIPKIRGSYRSVPMEHLLEDAKRLAANGVKELLLVAQETTLYGMDLYGHRALPELLRKLCLIDGIEWIRVLYLYPEELDEELIQTMKTEPKICHYLDLPIQHASDNILRKMGRRTNQEQLRSVISNLREQIPDICIRTTLIAGFPGETQEDFEELYRFVNEMEFDRLGVFPYSREEDTVAADMPDQIPEEIKVDRARELMELQQEIAFEKTESMPGRRLKCIIEGRIPEEGIYVARTYMDAPGIDGFLFLSSDRDFITGTFVDVLVTGSNEYDLIGEIIEEDEE